MGTHYRVWTQLLATDRAAEFNGIIVGTTIPSIVGREPEGFELSMESAGHIKRLIDIGGGSICGSDYLRIGG
jgi:hypothetical protein